MLLRLLLFCMSAGNVFSASPTPLPPPLKFPENLLIGTATSAYQIEGAWNASGKGESVWDYYLHREPERVADRTNGDVACDSVRLFRRDVQMVKELGMQTYRFSLSWPRLLPDGTLFKINQHGVDYYNNLIDHLLAHGIQPIVTLFHWDLPMTLQNMGGWTNPAIVDYFEDYARFAIGKFGDRVKLWLTVNEPFQVCEFGYSDKIMAPFYNLSGVGGYRCNHWMIYAHARVYRMYKNVFAQQNGRMGLSIHSYWFDPKDPSDPNDYEATDRGMQFNLGLSAHQIFGKGGDYPKTVRELVDSKSAKQGLLRSRLPYYTDEEIELMKGAADFLGLNHYFTQLAKHNTSQPEPSLYSDAMYTGSVNESWPGFSFTKNTPWGLRKLLNWIRTNYDNPLVLITENGYSDPMGRLDDEDRVQYYKGYMAEMLKAISDGCNVFGYTAWSLMDNFEWTLGLTFRFGLFHVDFNDPNRKRVPKQSALFFSNLTRTRVLTDY